MVVVVVMIFDGGVCNFYDGFGLVLREEGVEGIISGG